MDWQQLASFITPMGFALLGLWRIAGWFAKRLEAKFDQAEDRRVADKKEVKEALAQSDQKAIDRLNTHATLLNAKLDTIETQTTTTNGRVTFIEGVMFGREKPNPLRNPTKLLKKEETDEPE